MTDQSHFFGLGFDDQSLWERTDSGLIQARSIDVLGQLLNSLTESQNRDYLLEQYGLLSGADSTPSFSNFKLEFIEGQPGLWDEAEGTLTPSWENAFSDQPVYFRLWFDVTELIDGSEIQLQGLTSEFFISFDRSGLDLATVLADSGTDQSIPVFSDNGIGILLAYSADRQQARGVSEPTNIQLYREDVADGFDQQQFDHLLSIDQSAGNLAPTLSLVASNNYIEDSADNSVGSVVGNHHFPVGMFVGDPVAKH